MTSILKVDTLQDSGGNAILSSNGTGTITTSSALNTAITNAGFVTSANAGKVLQVVNAVDSTIRSTTSTSFVTGSNTVSVNITPSSTSNKILVIGFTLTRGVTGIANAVTALYRNNSTQLAQTGADHNGTMGATGFSYLDSPNTTSSTNYQIYFKATGGGGNTVYMNTPDGGIQTIGTITAMEIAV